MFTVLIAEKEHLDAIQQENRLFFEPFLESKELAFCHWNPEGQNLYDSVPGLMDAVGRRNEWRAVIINNSNEDLVKKQNPFDIVDYSAVTALEIPSDQPNTEASWNAWEEKWQNYYKDLSAAKESVYRNALSLPLQKLSTWLCFRPEDYILNDVQEKKDAVEWARQQLQRDEQKAVAVMEDLERKQYRYELRLKEIIRREFIGEKRLNIAYPTEINCISIRMADRSFFDPDTHWNIPRESEYSSFADRNMYFDKMRFMVFDMLPPTHRNYRTDYIRFLASILIFVSNSTPGSAMQARKLYRFETESDETPLCTLITSYDRKLAATYENIEDEMDRIRSEIPGELTDKVAEALFCKPTDVSVLLDDSCDVNSVYADKDYGLFYDSPQNEFSKWNSNYRRSIKELNYIAKQQGRSVRRSVNQLNLSSEVNNVNISRLTPLQIEDVVDSTNAAEDEMIASIPKDLTDVSEYTKRLSEESENVEKKIRTRMTTKTTMILGTICLGLYLICFLPFLLSNNGTPKTISTAIVFGALMIGALAAILFVCLLFLRMSLIKDVRQYNEVVDDVMSDINSSMKRFSQYLSASCNVRRGYKVQNHAHNTVDEYTKSLRIRKRHQEDIRKRRAYIEEEYGDYIGDRAYCDEVMSRPYEYDFGLKREYDYPAPFLAGDCRQIEFMSNGNYVTVPSSYIRKIVVRMEEIYEK